MTGVFSGEVDAAVVVAVAVVAFAVAAVVVDIFVVVVVIGVAAVVAVAVVVVAVAVVAVAVAAVAARILAIPRERRENRAVGSRASSERNTRHDDAAADKDDDEDADAAAAAAAADADDGSLLSSDNTAGWTDDRPSLIFNAAAASLPFISMHNNTQQAGQDQLTGRGQVTRKR